MSDLFDAAAMYDEDYLYFFAAPDGMGKFAAHGPVLPGADVPGLDSSEVFLDRARAEDKRMIIVADLP